MPRFLSARICCMVVPQGIPYSQGQGLPWAMGGGGGIIWSPFGAETPQSTACTYTYKASAVWSI